MTMSFLAEGENKPSSVKSDINVTPMVDIMLVLLIIFMVVTPMLQHGVSVDLAKAKNPREMKEADRDDAILIAVNRDGRFFMGSDEIKRDQIAQKVKDLLDRKTGDKTVYIKSDRRAKYGDVSAVVDEVRTAGVDAVGLITEKEEERRGGASSSTPPSTP
ncbi:MAG: biopolymer transporter ExbD [Acidobacteriia bacterium]|nr:biopolymer transporter ExbD [Terriglobia bacterium]